MIFCILRVSGCAFLPFSIINFVADPAIYREQGKDDSSIIPSVYNTWVITLFTPS